MNILKIDALSYAARVAHVASAELYGLLATGEVGPDNGWYLPDGASRKPEQIAADIELMAAYVLKTDCKGETLYLRGGGADWAGLPLERKMAFDLFCMSMSGCGNALFAAQAEAEQEAERKRDLRKRKRANKVRTADTIFARHGSIGQMSPERVAADQRAVARRKEEIKAARIARKKQRAKDRAAFNGADPSKFDHDGDGRPGGSLPSRSGSANRSQAQKPLSVGEPPAKKPVNRGGRGKRKKTV